jgi:hypothetical protein
MTSEQLVDMLDESTKEFVAAANAIPDARAGAQPGSGRWSVKDCVEHVTVAEERFLTLLSNAMPAGELRIDGSREVALGLAIADRSTRAVAPDVVRPADRYATLADALAGFHQARSRTVELAKARYADLYSLDLEHRRFGPVNGIELMVIIAGHARRHAAQIREALSDLAASEAR